VKKVSDFHIFLLICSVTLLFSGCERDKPPKLTTTAVTEIQPTSAKAGGLISDDGNTDIIVRGVCWGTRDKPTIEGTRTTDGYGMGSYTSSITQLTPNTLYYVRAYATNKVGTAYGNQLTFTSAELAVASLSTASVTAITSTTAVSGGTITSDGGSDVTQRGVCWSTHTGPVITDSHTSDGTGTGSFSSNLTGLTGNTAYYVRAYAVNTQGTSYGQEVSFTSSPQLPSITTTVPSPSSTTTGTGGGTVTSDGGSAVTSRGVCWNTTVNPTIANSKTTNGTGTGVFTSNMTGMAVNTEYHVRAYATNSVGTAYGTDYTFRTDPATILDYDNNVYNVVRIGTQLWLKENLKTTRFKNGTSIPLTAAEAAWAGLTTSGYCWYDNDDSNKAVYGALYNWFAVKTGNLCPTGWHVANDDTEWITLETYLGGASPAGGKLKETGTTHWLSPNTGATNETGFTSLPGGYRHADGSFSDMGYNGYWWSSREYNVTDAFFKKMQNTSDKTFRAYMDENGGMSVRCIKD
jgi:uncharacterized protein (TIGR02145 family)